MSSYALICLIIKNCIMTELEILTKIINQFIGSEKFKTFAFEILSSWQTQCINSICIVIYHLNDKSLYGV